MIATMILLLVMPMASLCSSVLASTKAAVTNASISITFNETLKGYSWEGGTENDTIHDFQIAYEKGKIANEIMSFSLQVDIVDVAKWRVDPLHNAVCAGHVVDTNITNNRSILVGQGGALHVFDGGVHKDTHELRMEYILPFTENGRNYTLYGVKHLPGNDCLGLLSQSTTLYVHVYDDDDDAKKIIRTGIVKIGPLDVVSLVESMRVHGGTVADQIKGFLTFGLLLVGDILENCLAKAAHDTKFWYVWASDGNTGFILDLIKRPQTLELRLAQFMGNSTTNMTSSVSVHRQTLPLDQFSVGTDNITVNFGSDMKMSPNGVIGTVDGVFVNVSFNLNGRSNKFLPPELAVLDLDTVLPTPMSEYGQVGNWPSGGMVGEHVLRSAVPVVRTNYNIPYGLDSNLLKLYFPHITFKNRYGFQIDQFLLIANLEAKKEFDYKLSQINSEDFNPAIFSENKNSEFDQEHSQFSFRSQPELLKKSALSDKDFDNTIHNIFKSIGGISWGINNYNNRAHHGLSIKKFYPKKVDKKILWKVNIPKLTWGPYALNNHRSGTKDIIVQDQENTIYLISAGGKVKWSRNLEGKILGGISQIDAYQNNKYQMVFNTKSKLHIVDILGNEIDGFPIKFSYFASNPVSIFDYDNNKDYRFLIAGDDFKIHNYNISGTQVSGWIQPELNSTIARQLKHFAINGLDYILSIQNSGVIKLHNRRGGERFAVKNKAFLPAGSNFSINKSFIIDSTSIVFEDTLRGVSKLVLGSSSKRIHTIPDSLNPNENFWNIFVNKKFNKVNFCLKQKERLKVIDQSKEEFDFQFYYPYDILHGKRFDNFMAILNVNTNEIQLIDSKYNINPNLFRASKMSCIGNINNDNSKELITVVNNNILICYQIPSLN